MKTDTPFILAQHSLLASHSLEVRNLEQVFKKMLAHRVDYGRPVFSVQPRRKLGT